MKSQRSCLDRISALPQPIIEDILCRLPIEDVVRTSILSRNWRYTWTEIPKLVFIERQVKVSTDDYQVSVPTQRRSMTKRCKIFNAISQVLLLHQGPIDEFSLSMYDDKTCVELNRIILDLSRNNALKKFTLCLRHSSFGYSYRLPFSFFSLNQLRHLSLSGCHLGDQPTFKGFGSLTTLYLENVDVSQNMLLYFVSSCPLLKSFTLYIDDSNIIGDVDDTNITMLFDCLHGIEHLDISYETIRCFAEDTAPEELPIDLVHLKFFCSVDVSSIQEYWLPFMALVIRSSPNLEKLRLVVLPCIYLGKSKIEHDEFEINLQDYSNIWLEHLKELEVADFMNYNQEMEFVKLILAKSPALKKVSIFFDCNVTADEEMKVLRILLCSTRASPHVKIFVER